MSTAFILGAGASYGSDIKEGLRPPLTSKLLIEASKSRPSEFGRIAEWATERLKVPTKDLLFGRVDFEGLLEKIDSEILKAREDDYGIHLRRGEVIDLVPELLIGSSVATLRESCRFHEKVARSLTKDDVVLNFNYDFLMDSALAKAGKLTDLGAAVELMGFTQEWTGNSIRTLEKFKANSEDPPHLKLHGSLNWFSRTAFDEVSAEMSPKPNPAVKGIKIVAPREKCIRNFLKLRGSLSIGPKKYVLVDDLLVPPMPVKSPLAGPQWKKLWGFAQERLSRCSRWVAIGYSFREQDKDSTALFSAAAKSLGSGLRIEMVGPCGGGEIERARKLCPKAKVINEHKSFAGFATKE